jgi:hypothetical protein
MQVVCGDPGDLSHGYSYNTVVKIVYIHDCTESYYVRFLTCHLTGKHGSSFLEPYGEDPALEAHILTETIPFIIFDDIQDLP